MSTTSKADRTTRRRVYWLAVLLVSFSAVLVGQDARDAFSNSIKVDDRELLEDLRILSADDMQGRRTATTGNAKARAYIVRRFRQSRINPFDDGYLQPFRFSLQNQTTTIQGANVIGYIGGSANPGRFIVVTAHYDHLGIRDGQVYNGADDNASGVAALFAIAKYFGKARPSSSILLAALDAEEIGGFGARELLRAPPVGKRAIMMNVNLDMICRDHEDTLYASGAYHYPFLQPYLEAIAPSLPVKLRFGHDRPDQPDFDDWTEDSDHIWFHREGIPFIYFGVEDYEHHHRPTDRYENITPEFYIAAVETIIRAIEEFDRNLANIGRQGRRM